MLVQPGKQMWGKIQNVRQKPKNGVQKTNPAISFRFAILKESLAGLWKDISINTKMLNTCKGLVRDSYSSKGLVLKIFESYNAKANP